ncbi:O-antigen ligase family protein [Candidatus Saccharibacteria bacterium]|nr:O-antigen ligase family protein [Candidatus Saccharibacteria bacterium]
MKKLVRTLLYVMPVALLFSYFPVITLGSDATMNFELSVAVIWLVVFDVVGMVAAVLEFRAKIFAMVSRWWMWLLFPTFVLLSVVWSLNVTRGVLTAGMLWALVVAGFLVWHLRSWFDEGFWQRWLRWFLGAGLFACLWCVVQCVMDVAGVTREVTGMCAGCTYAMFGFPHPNGFFIEPQFMGNFLIAPAMVAAMLCLRKCCKKYNGLRSFNFGFLLVCFFVYSATIFLTFSRGAIYALIVGLLVMTVWGVVRTRKWRALWVWPVVIVAFLMTLALQGLMAEVSPTNDTYATVVAKVLNHLSLGIIDVREKGDDSPVVDEGGAGILAPEYATAPESVDDRGEEAVFDGYVAESTDTRLRLTSAAVEVWRRDFRTVMVGVGVGGAGQALYNAGLSPAPKEIVQNEYASLLLETGTIGVLLFVVTMGLAVVLALRCGVMAPVVTGILVAYLVSICFFSGLPNALHIVLFFAVLITMWHKETRKL